MAEIKNINISQFAEQFQNEYDILYESDCTDDGVRFAAWCGSFLRLSDGLYVEKRMICACSNTDIRIYINMHQ